MSAAKGATMRAAKSARDEEEPAVDVHAADAKVPAVGAAEGPRGAHNKLASIFPRPTLAPGVHPVTSLPGAA